MRSLPLLLSLLLGAVLPGCRSAAPPQPPGQAQTLADFEAASRHAAAEGRLLLVVPTGRAGQDPGIEAWRAVHGLTTHDPEVRAAIEAHAAVFLVDVERDRELRLALDMSADGSLLLYREGVLWDRSLSRRDPAALTLWLEDAREGRSGLGWLAQQIVYGRRERDLTLRLDYADALMRAGAYDEAAREVVWIEEHFDELDDPLAMTRFAVVQVMGALAAAHPPAHALFVSLPGMKPLHRRDQYARARKRAREGAPRAARETAAGAPRR